MTSWVFLCGFILGVAGWILLQLSLLKEHYVTARMTRRLPQLIKPMVRTMETQKIREMRAADNDSPEESCMWLNVIFARLWSELRDTEAFSRTLKELLHSELIDLKRDPIGVILGEPSELRLSDVYLGDSAPNLDNVTVLSQRNFPRHSNRTASVSSTMSAPASTSTQPSTSTSGPVFPTSASDPNPLPSAPSSSDSSSLGGKETEFSMDPELSVIFDVNYLGGCAFVAEIPTTLGFFFTVSFRLVELSGRMFVQFREKPDSTFSFAFYDMPKMKTETHLLINGTEFGLLTRFFEKQIMEVFREKLVLPNMKTKWFMNGPEQPPYPWELKEGETEATLYDWKPKTDLPFGVGQERTTFDSKGDISPVSSGGSERVRDSVTSSEGDESDHDKTEEVEPMENFGGEPRDSVPRRRVFPKEPVARMKTM